MRRASETSIVIAEQVFAIIHELDPRLQLNFRKAYVGLARGGIVDNFILIYPRKQNRVVVTFRVARSEEIDARLADRDVEFQYNTRRGRYRIELSQASVEEHRDLLRDLARLAHGKLEED